MASKPSGDEIQISAPLRPLGEEFVAVLKQLLHELLKPGAIHHRSDRAKRTAVVDDVDDRSARIGADLEPVLVANGPLVRSSTKRSDARTR